MTQPIQEPTSYRTMSKFGYNQRQLERRPSPESTAEAAMNMPMAEIQGTVSIASGLASPCNWTAISSFHEYDPNGAFTINAAPTTTPISIVEAGLYLIAFNVSWDTPTFGDVTFVPQTPATGWQAIVGSLAVEVVEVSAAPASGGISLGHSWLMRKTADGASGNHEFWVSHAGATRTRP